MRVCLFLAPLAAALIPLVAAEQQAATEQPVVVSGTESNEEFEEPGGYGQPQWAERSRASATTKLYVLTPFEVFLGIVSESDFLSHNHFAEELTEEIEIGLPHRFELDLENHLGFARGDVAESAISVGLR